MSLRCLRSLVASSVLGCSYLVSAAWAQTVVVDASEKGRRQTIDGFGTYVAQDKMPDEAWYQKLVTDDLRSSIVRVDLSPKFKSPWSDHTYNSPWFHGDPALPGPEGNNVRTYTGPADYTREYNGRRATIAVLGPDIDDNINRFFNYDHVAMNAGGRFVSRMVNDPKLYGPVKLYGSVWSPAPWLKLSSGNKIGPAGEPLPKAGAEFPFIWYDCFAGGVLDVSGTPRPEFNDAALPGGTGPTSALTQYARGFAAWVRGYQNHFGVKFYAISIQNEPHLEIFYNSCLYKTSADFIAALKAARSEFDKYDDLKDIKLVGPEDTIGGESTYLWFWDNNGFRQHKLLQIMQAIESDPVAAKALAFYNVHGYAADGITSAGAEPKSWEWSARGWTDAPNPQVPPNVKGYESYGKKFWMTETSGEHTEWLYPRAGFPTQGAFSIALKLHQALEGGNVTGWLYWSLVDPKDEYEGALTNPKVLGNAPKLIAAKHYFRHIRPGAVRYHTSVGDTKKIKATTFLDTTNGTAVWVLINASKQPINTTVEVPADWKLSSPALAFTSSSESMWKESAIEQKNNAWHVTLPEFGVVTLVTKIAR